MENDVARMLYNNPAKLKRFVTEDLENRLMNGTPITDPNSPFMYLLEMSCVLPANAIEIINNSLSTIYAKRAQTMNDLNKHISDMEKIDMFATPAKSSISILMDKDVLIERSLINDKNSAYKKIEIPVDSVVLLGGVPFGFHFPINININKTTNNFSIHYDREFKNDLVPADSSYLEYKEFSYDNTNFIDIKVPIYQYHKTIIEQDISATVSFSKTVEFSDKIHGIRVFTFKGDSWIELDVSYSNYVYNENKPTAIVDIDYDTASFKVSVPHIYFYKNMIGNKMRIWSFTTRGEVDINLSGLNAGDVKFITPVQRDNRLYSTILDKLELLRVVPLEKRITGGKDQITFEALKNKVHNKIYSDGPLISTNQIKNHYKELGFDVFLNNDSFRDRVYTANSPLKDISDNLLSGGHFKTILSFHVLDESFFQNYLVEDNSGNSITLLPSFEFVYNVDKQLAFPLDSDTKNNLLSAYSSDKNEFCGYMNERYFLQSPYHTHIKIKHNTAYTSIIDLTNPSITNFDLNSENLYVIEHFQILKYGVIHNCLQPLNKSEYKYEFVFIASIPKNIQAVIKDFTDTQIKEIINLFISIRSKNKLSLQRSRIKTIDKEKGTIEFICVMKPTYKFGHDSSILIETTTLNVMSNIDQWFSITESTFSVPLNCTLQLMFTFKDINLPLYIETEMLDTDIANIIGVDHKQMAIFNLDVKLGRDITNTIYNSTNLVYYTGYYDDLDIVDKPKTYAEDVYEIYDRDVPARDDKDGLIVEYDCESGGSLNTPTINVDSNSSTPSITTNNLTTSASTRFPMRIKYDHVKGEIVKDEYGNPKILHYKGEPILNNYSGVDYINRKRLISMDLLMVSSNYYYTDSSFEKNTIRNITYDLERKYNTLIENDRRLLEKTRVVYRASKTIGRGLFYSGSINYFYDMMDIKLSFKIYLYNNYVNDDRLKSIIKDNLTLIVEMSFKKGTISLIQIGTDIKNMFKEYIRHVDVLGINDNMELQALDVADDDIYLSLKQIMYSDNNVIKLKKSIDLVFI